MEKLVCLIAAASALSAVSPLTVRQYHFIYDPKNWTEAQSYCRETYTDLVTVDNPDVMTTLNKMVDRTQMGSYTSAWNGLFFDEVSWKWLSAEQDFYQRFEPDFNNWDVGQPDVPWYLAGCGLMYSSGKWHDTYCDNVLTSVCSNMTGQSVAFFFISTPMTWIVAQNYYREHYTDLAVPRNLSENQKMMAVIPGGVFSWIGHYRESWKWSGGPMYVFQRWVGGQPNGGTEKCAATMFDVSGYWADLPCATIRPFICHHDSVPFTKQVVKVRLEGNSTLDLSDPAVLENLKEELKRKVVKQGVVADVQLSWETQRGGKIFYKEKKNKDQN